MFRNLLQQNGIVRSIIHYYDKSLTVIHKNESDEEVFPQDDAKDISMYMLNSLQLLGLYDYPIFRGEFRVNESNSETFHGDWFNTDNLNFIPYTFSWSGTEEERWNNENSTQNLNDNV